MLFFSLCALAIISYSFKMEFSFCRFDCACVSEIVRDNHPYNPFLIRKKKVSGQLKN